MKCAPTKGDDSLSSSESSHPLQFTPEAMSISSDPLHANTRRSLTSGKPSENSQERSVGLSRSRYQAAWILVFNLHTPPTYPVSLMTLLMEGYPTYVELHHGARERGVVGRRLNTVSVRPKPRKFRRPPSPKLSTSMWRHERLRELHAHICQAHHRGVPRMIFSRGTMPEPKQAKILPPNKATGRGRQEMFPYVYDTASSKL